jgi:hypothetical protein
MKWSTAGWARYIRVNGLGTSVGLHDFIKRTAIRADEINLGGFDRYRLTFTAVAALRRFGCGRREGVDEAGAAAPKLM